MKNKIDISFVMLTWNRNEFVKRCLNSFIENISNSYTYEFLITDNGSTDGTKETLKEFSSKIPQMKILFNSTNKGLSEYKKLFNSAKGNLVFIIDDDVISFPSNFDKTVVNYFSVFPEIGLFALDVVQDEFTNGAKPESTEYIEKSVNNKIIQIGPTGGWATAFKKSDYRKIKLFFNLIKIDMSNGEDGTLSKLLHKICHKECAIIKDVKCLHACGPYYSKKFGFLERDIEKYEIAGMNDISSSYKNLTGEN